MLEFLKGIIYIKQNKAVHKVCLEIPVTCP